MKADDWQAAMEALITDTGTHHVRIKNKRYTEQLAKNYDTFASVVETPKWVLLKSKQNIFEKIVLYFIYP